MFQPQRLAARMVLNRGILYLVATPIGNLEDITFRAVKVLGGADLIAAEDTRRTYRLLRRFNIGGRLVSYHEHNVEKRLPLIVQSLNSGKKVALVSDAGTPLINDPGFKLVRETIQQGIRVVPVPGASAVLSALVASGLPPYPFVFLGYLPKKPSRRWNLLLNYSLMVKGRARLSSGDKIKQKASDKGKGLALTFVAFESPYRVIDSLKDVAQAFGGDCLVSVAREMTKVHEEFTRGRINDVIRNLMAHSGRVKGEITLVWCKRQS